MDNKGRTSAHGFLFAVALSCVAVLATPTRSQEPTPTPQQEDEVIRISSDLVQTDVMVFDKQGKFVDGLKPEQFTIVVDGKPQTVLFFEQIKSGTFDEEAQLAAARGLSRPDRSGASVVPLDRGRVFLLFFDDLHIQPGNFARARDTLMRFVEEQMGQNDEAAIFTTSGQLGFLSQLTDDKVVLRIAVKRLVSRFLDTRETGEQNPMTEYQAFAIERGDRQMLDFFVERVTKERLGGQAQVRPRGAGTPLKRDPRNPTTTPGIQTSAPVISSGAIEAIVRARAKQLVEQALFGVRNTMATLENVVRGASSLPGRKVLFFISDGFFIDTQNSSTLEELRRVSASAALSGTVIYSLDAHGLSATTTIPDVSTRATFDPGNQLASVNSSALTAYQEPLHTLAVETGGHALLDTNDLSSGVKHAVNETLRYYLLAWKPEGDAGRGGKFHHIEVKVKDRPDLTVRVRSGYSDESPKAAADKEKKKEKEKEKSKKNPIEIDLMGALKALYPRRSLPTSLAAGFLDVPAGDPQLTVSIEVDAQTLGFKADGSGDEASLDVVGAVVNDDGKSVSEFEQNLTVSAIESGHARRRVIYNHQLQLKPGLYQVRVAARDRRTGRLGSATQWLEVPDIKKGGLALSSLFVGETSDGSSQLSICADHRFARTSRLGFFLYVYNAARASASPDVALQVQIFRDDQPVVTRPLFKIETAGVSDLARLPYGEDLSLDALPAGRYVLQVTAIDRAAKTSTSQRTTFIVQ